MKDKTKRLPRLAGGLAVGLVALHALWPSLWGGDTLLNTHDNLDANHAVFYRLAHDPVAFGGARELFTPTLGGTVQRGTLQSEVSVLFWVYRLAPSHLAAYRWHHLMVVVVAFAGMWAMLRRVLRCALSHEASAERDALADQWAALLAAIYALIPFFPAFSLGVAGLPAVAWALWQLAEPEARRPRWLPWLVLVVYAVAGPVYYTTAFAAAAGTAMLAWLGWRRRRTPWVALGGVAVMSLVALAAEWRLVVLMLGGDLFASHRIEFAAGYSSLNVKGIVLESILHWLAFESNSYDRLAVGAVGVVALVLLGIFALRGDAPERRWARYGLVIAGVAYVFASLELVLKWGAISPLLEAYFSLPLTRTFSIARFFVLVPMLWVLVIGLVGVLLSARLARQGKPAWVAAALPALVFVALLVQGASGWAPYARYYLARLGQGEISALRKVRRADPTLNSYRQFYAEGLWAQVRAALPSDTTRIGCVGLHPGAAQINGLNTVDGYASVYPLAYKHRFRTAIAPELERNAALKAYYDGWGSRAYFFSAELFELGAARASLTEVAPTQINSLHYSLEALRSLGVHALVSALPIGNASALGLHERAIIRASEYTTSLYVYQLTPEAH